MSATREPHPVCVALRAERIKRKKSQRWVAAALGVAQASVGGWETGEFDPCLSNLERWAALFDFELTLY